MPWKTDTPDQAEGQMESCVWHVYCYNQKGASVVYRRANELTDFDFIYSGPERIGQDCVQFRFGDHVTAVVNDPSGDKCFSIVFYKQQNSTGDLWKKIMYSVLEQLESHGSVAEVSCDAAGQKDRVTNAMHWLAERRKAIKDDARGDKLNDLVNDYSGIRDWFEDLDKAFAKCVVLSADSLKAEEQKMLGVAADHMREARNIVAELVGQKMI